MVEISSMEIVGTADTGEIDRGFERINNNFSIVKSQAESASASFGRLGEIAGGLGRSMVMIGAAGVGALTAIASRAPAVAPVMARIGNQFREISFELGRTLLPIFEMFSDTVVPMLGGAAMDLANVVTGEWGQIDNLFGKGSGAAIGFAIGFKVGGPKGAFLGAALGAAAGDKMQEAFTGTVDTIGSGISELLLGEDVIPQEITDQMGGAARFTAPFVNVIGRLMKMIESKFTETEYGGYTPVR